jgi:hypothetical protein
MAVEPDRIHVEEHRAALGACMAGGLDRAAIGVGHVEVRCSEYI